MKNEKQVQLNSQQLVLKELSTLPHLVKNQKKIFLKKGEDPLNSLNTSQYFYFILQGKVKIFQIDFNSQRELTLYLLTRGDMFDVVSLLDGSSRDYLSEVLEDVELIEVPLSDIQNMILDDNAFRVYFYTYLASQLKSMEELAINISFYDVYQRVLQLFTKFTYMKDNKATLKVIDNLKHEDLASMVGSVRKVVNRSLQKLKKDGIIDLSRKKINIVNFQKILEKLDI